MAISHCENLAQSSGDLIGRYQLITTLKITNLFRQSVLDLGDWYFLHSHRERSLQMIQWMDFIMYAFTNILHHDSLSLFLESFTNVATHSCIIQEVWVRKLQHIDHNTSSRIKEWSEMSPRGAMHCGVYHFTSSEGRCLWCQCKNVKYLYQIGLGIY